MNKIRYNVIIIVWIIQPLSHDDTNILRPNPLTGLTNCPPSSNSRDEKLKNRCFYRLASSYLCGPTWYSRFMLAHPQKCKLFIHNYNNKDDKTDTNSPREGGRGRSRRRGRGEEETKRHKTTKRILFQDPLRTHSTRITNSWAIDRQSSGELLNQKYANRCESHTSYRYRWKYNSGAADSSRCQWRGEAKLR